jgi:DNA-binding transcriptional LysR family regulator
VRLLPGYRLTNSTFDNGVYALFRHTRMLPHKVRVFVDFLAEALGELEAANRGAQEPLSLPSLRR